MDEGWNTLCFVPYIETYDSVECRTGLSLYRPDLGQQICYGKADSSCADNVFDFVSFQLSLSNEDKRQGIYACTLQCLEGSHAGPYAKGYQHT